MSVIAEQMAGLVSAAKKAAIGEELRHILRAFQKADISRESSESSVMQHSFSNSFSSTAVPILASIPKQAVDESEGQNQAVYRAFTKGQPLFEQWLMQHGLLATKVSGNRFNCFIYSLLQHALGEYHIYEFEPSHVDQIKNKAGINPNTIEMRYSDTSDASKILKAINEIYNVNLEAHFIQINEEGRPIISSELLDATLPSTTRQPVVVWQQPGHYVSVTSHKLKVLYQNKTGTSVNEGISQELLSLIEQAGKVGEELEIELKSFQDLAIQKHLKMIPLRVKKTFEIIKKLVLQKTNLKHTLQNELKQIQSFIESNISFVESEGGSYSEKIQAVELLGRITNQFFLLSNTLESKPAVKLEANSRWRDERLRLEQQLVCKETQVNKLLEELLEELREMAGLNFSVPNQCFISYAWASKEVPHEKWIQPFLLLLRKHLRIAGVNAKVDVRDNPGGNIYQYMNRIKDADCVVIIGTESLLQKHDLGVSAICSELILINRRRAQDGKKKTLPILLSGDFVTALPPYFSMYTTVKDWREKSYVANLKALLSSIYSIGPDNAEYDNLWVKFEEKYSILMRGISEDDVNLQLGKEKQLSSQQKELDSQQVTELFSSINKSQTCIKFLEELKAAAYYKKLEKKDIIREFEGDFYIEPYGCDPEENLMKMEEAKWANLSLLKNTVKKDFIAGPEQVLLLTGGPGSGKTIFSYYLERCWDRAEDSEEPIMIYCYLPHIRQPAKKLMEEIFKRYGLEAEKVANRLKNRKNVCFILDAYDEIREFQIDPSKALNLYTGNHLNEWENAKFIITCRDSFLERLSSTATDRSYKSYFAPAGLDKPCLDLLKIVQIAPFSALNIGEYIRKYLENHGSNQDWTIQKYQEEIENLPNVNLLVSTPLLLKMTVQALPIIVGWHAAMKQQNPNRYIDIAKRDIFLAYLKDNLIRVENTLKQAGREIPPNESFMNFLINLGNEMVDRQEYQVAYLFRPGNTDEGGIDEGPEWARPFFGDPYKGTNAKKLRNRKEILSNLTCLLTYEMDAQNDHGYWSFIHNDFAEVLFDVHKNELTKIRAQLMQTGRVGLQEVNQKAIREFSRILFCAPEGHYYVTKDSDWAAAIGIGQPTPIDKASKDILFSESSEDMAVKLRRHSADRHVAADENYKILVKNAISRNVHLGQSTNGNTALHWALKEKQALKIIIFLNELKTLGNKAGEALKIENKEGKTVLRIFNEIRNSLENTNHIHELMNEIMAQDFSSKTKVKLGVELQKR